MLNSINWEASKVGDLDIFCHEAGPKGAPAILLLR
jgi:hypothetical protein